MSRNTASTYNYNDGFNHDFTDEDAQRLISIASSPELSLHVCRWVIEGGAAGVRCGSSIQGLHFAAHLRDFHGIHSIGYQYLGFSCRWEGCTDGSTFTKEGLWKHVQDKHLSWKWNCPNCGAVFMHKMARNTHYANCTGVIAK